MSMKMSKSKSRSVRIDISLDVHRRLLKFGTSFPQRINTLLACKEVVLIPVRRPTGPRKGIHVTRESHKTLLLAQEALGCPSLSNTIESMLNTRPNIPLHFEIKKHLLAEPVNSTLRVKKSDHTRIVEIANKEAIPVWQALHMLVTLYTEGGHSSLTEAINNQEGDENDNE